MKTRTFLICSLLLAGSSLPVLAQGRSENASLSAEQRLAEEIGLERLPDAPTPADARNIAALLQQGVGNTGNLTQNNTGVLANTAFIEQVGMTNAMNLTQTGEGNKTFISQRGDRNTIGVALTGDKNEMELVQNGDDNVINSTVASDSRKYSVSQQGSNNVLNQLESTPLAPKGYSVEMRGSGIQLTIEQGKVF